MQGKRILCLAGSGGQQAPVLAAAGADVVVVDASQDQLALDEMVAKRDNLSLRTVLGDMQDLSAFNDESFDLIFHPISNLYVSNI
ncbi:class I SAM-dependent methyltransferase [Pseudomonas arcuscaelestis]|uniref:class I SAM-dependent methyltransferase n=1 Tax=Pseudomonas arcuscaelestis TaxID=2710591 RepID=UPI002E27DFE6|nr:class I SAM-dependent methyltransferase [Pseudomonas arcuscaelestis]